DYHCYSTDRSGKLGLF
nr:immunoglobulin light chain junction region [Macaca mulatta]